MIEVIDSPLWGILLLTQLWQVVHRWSGCNNQPATFLMVEKQSANFANGGCAP